MHRLRSLVSRLPGTTEEGQRYTPPPFPDPELLWRTWRLVHTLKPDVIHTYGWLSYPLILGARGTDAPVILSARDYGNVCPKRTLVRQGKGCSGPGWRKCAGCAPDQYGRTKGLVATISVLGGRGYLRRRVDVLHSCSHYMQEVMQRDLFDGRTATSRSSVVIPDFRDEPPPPGPREVATAPPLPSEPYILFVGALREVKGIKVLVEAYERLGEPRPPLVLVGGVAPDTPSFPPGVTVIHDLPNDVVLALWDRALFGVAPSVLHEPLGNVVHEAMSRGRPVIGTTPGGHGEMIRDGVSGLLVPGGDVEALVRAMRTLIDDEALRTGMAAEARIDASRFTESVVFPQFESLYTRAFEESNRRQLSTRS